MYYRFEDLTHTVGFVGLNEYARHITGADLHDSADAYKVGVACVAHMRAWADRMTRETGWRWTLTQTPAETTAGRFASLDLQEYGSRAIVNGDRKSGAVYYTNSSHMKVDTPTSIGERARLEGKFHPLCNGGHIAHFFLGESYPDPEALLSLTEKLCRQTDLGLFDYTKDLTVCKQCGTTSGGLIPKCPRCGNSGASLEYYSRITGYCQRIGTGTNTTGGWNKYKLAELKDRKRHNVCV
jgi:ribonucleoside-triphosphate reductase